MNCPEFQPGDLVRTRGREWINLPQPMPGWLSLRPLTGGESDKQLICLAFEKVHSATFQPPPEGSTGTKDSFQLLADALRLSLRRGAGPFRSAAHLSFEPRAYQLVPLLMALRLPVIRLLVADDVGVGKTIEAALIVRELLDRGELDSFSVLCPPHLVEQWTAELRDKFSIDAVAVTASSASRLERSLPVDKTIFDVYPFTVVSLDYIKAEQRRESFARSCPPLVIVDEAHACVGVEGGRQQRYELLKRLAGDPSRHLLLLSATPHSGNESAFDRLLALIDPAFAGQHVHEDTFRRQLAKHFVQRRRLDVTEPGWQQEDCARVFPDHQSSEPTYALTGPHLAFHDAVLDYCLGVVETAGDGPQIRRLAFWGTLALMRCVGSSPAAALSALRNRAISQASILQQQVMDQDEDSDALDLEPDTAFDTAEDPALAALLARAEALLALPDPKFLALADILRPLLAAGANPVVFCRYLATAEALGVLLTRAFPRLYLQVVTGKLTADERRDRVAAMSSAPQRLLVATDCLSEGINLQELFDSVLHYDLSWNPTRHQQREGRVDRYGQTAPVVYTALLYSPDSAIDGAVLQVILHKARLIQQATGVTVPLPEKQTAIAGALMNAVLLHKGRTRQLSLALQTSLAEDAQLTDTLWRDAGASERRSRTRFAQNTLRPAEVLPEWHRWRGLLGSPEDVRSFVARALDHLQAPLAAHPSFSLVHVEELNLTLREQLHTLGLAGTVPVVFSPPATLYQGRPSQLVVRNHPLTATLAESVLEQALFPATLAPVRSAAWFTPAVATVTTILLLRLRFKLSITSGRNQQERLILVEEAETLGFQANVLAFAGDPARALLLPPANATLADHARARHLQQARTLFAHPAIAAHVQTRAALLAEDHIRVRTAAGATPPRVTVTPVLPPDIIGYAILLPTPEAF